MKNLILCSTSGISQGFSCGAWPQAQHRFFSVLGQTEEVSFLPFETQRYFYPSTHRTQFFEDHFSGSTSGEKLLGIHYRFNDYPFKRLNKSNELHSKIYQTLGPQGLLRQVFSAPRAKSSFFYYRFIGFPSRNTYPLMAPLGYGNFLALLVILIFFWILKTFPPLPPNG